MSKHYGEPKLQGPKYVWGHRLLDYLSNISWFFQIFYHYIKTIIIKYDFNM